jgi:hypothetical protein
MNVMNIRRPGLARSLRPMSAIHSMNERDIHRLLQSMIYFFPREVRNEGFAKGGVTHSLNASTQWLVEYLCLSDLAVNAIL